MTTWHGSVTSEQRYGRTSDPENDLKMRQLFAEKNGENIHNDLANAKPLIFFLPRWKEGKLAFSTRPNSSMYDFNEAKFANFLQIKIWSIFFAQLHKIPCIFPEFVYICQALRHHLHNFKILGNLRLQLIIRKTPHPVNIGTTETHRPPGHVIRVLAIILKTITAHLPDNASQNCIDIDRQYQTIEIPNSMRIFVQELRRNTIRCVPHCLRRSLLMYIYTRKAKFLLGADQPRKNILHCPGKCTRDNIRWCS